MTTSINQLRVKLKELQQSHPQLNDFFWGDFLRAYKENELNYPVMGCFYASGSMIQRQTSVQLTIYVADKVYKDYRNLNDVESDALQICRDLFNVINDAPVFKIIGRVESCNVTKFIEKGGDEVAGHQMTLSFKLRDSGATCGLPIEGFEFNIPSGVCFPVTITDGVNVIEVASGGAYTCEQPTPLKTGKLNKSGQIISYASGDEMSVTYGKLIDSYTLEDNNTLGNTNRFTDELGWQTYANNIVIDWSSYNGLQVLGYSRVIYDDNSSWLDAINFAQIKTLGSFGGWRLISNSQLNDITNEGVTSATLLNYPPFNITSNLNVWTSTTAPLNTSKAYLLGLATGDFGGASKLANGPRYMISRIFTVTGTILS